MRTFASLLAESWNVGSSVIASRARINSANKSDLAASGAEYDPNIFVSAADFESHLVSLKFEILPSIWAETTERFTPGPFYTSSGRTGAIFLQIFRAH